MTNPTDYLMAAHEAPELFGIPASTVRWWAHKNRLFAVGLDHSSRPLYRVAHVRTLVEAHPCYSRGSRQRFVSATGVPSDSSPEDSHQ